MNKIKTNKQFILGVVAGAVVVGILGSVVYFLSVKSAELSAKEIEIKSAEFVNSELMQGQGTATVKVVGEEGNMYKLEVSFNGQKLDSFVTKDGKRFFPQSFEIVKGNVASAGKADTTADPEPAAASVEKKSDKPVVELFVMSYCPYGTQMEKGIIPVVEALGNKIDFRLKFVSYTMHGDKENQENLRQYCIDKDQFNKFTPYLQCFLGSSDSAACLKSTGVDEGKVASCMASASKQFDITGKNFFVHKAENDKYGVQGSPTLVVNGATVQSGRDSASLLKTICSAFKNAPSECQKQLSGATPAPGFGSGTTSSAGSAAAGCASN